MSHFRIVTGACCLESKMDMQMKEEKKSTDTISSGSGDSQNAKMDTSTKEESTTTSQTISNNSATTTTAASVVSEESEQSEQANKMTSESANKQGTVSTPSTQSATPKETVDFKIVYNKRKYDITFELDNTVANLKQHIQTLTAVPPAMQKVMFKGLMKDDKTLRDSKVIKGAKVMVVGSTLTDVIAVNTPAAEAAKEEKTETEPTKEPLSKQKPHLKIIEKGKPDDALPGLKGVKERLPSVPLSGMVNKSGGKVRLTFKLEQDQLWLGTKERTEKLPMGSIKAVVSEAIHEHEEYHMLALQLGPTEASRYWIYWVPAQFVDAIKDAVLGKWQYF